jgi:hypothetical protein
MAYISAALDADAVFVAAAAAAVVVVVADEV